jgi:hypothetical protein
MDQILTVYVFVEIVAMYQMLCYALFSQTPKIHQIYYLLVSPHFMQLNTLPKMSVRGGIAQLPNTYTIKHYKGFSLINIGIKCIKSIQCRCLNKWRNHAYLLLPAHCG